MASLVPYLLQRHALYYTVPMTEEQIEEIVQQRIKEERLKNSKKGGEAFLKNHGIEGAREAMAKARALRWKKEEVEA